MAIRLAKVNGEQEQGRRGRKIPRAITGGATGGPWLFGRLKGSGRCGAIALGQL
jgi:hypothetical protein